MPRSLTEAFQGSDYTTVAHKHMYVHQSHTYTRTPPGCTRKRRHARGRSIYLLPYQASPHHSSHSIYPPGPTAALAELQGSQAVQTRPHDSQIGSGPPPAAATTHASAPVVFMCTPRSPRRVAYRVVRALVDMVASSMRPRYRCAGRQREFGPACRRIWPRWSSSDSGYSRYSAI